MNGFEKSVGWSEEHSFRANQLKRERKETKKERKRNKCFHKKKNINRKISEVEVVSKSSFTLEWRPLCIFFLSLTLGVFFLFLRQRDKIPYPINTNIRDCWPVFQVANKEKTLGPRLLALHFPVVLWYKWSRQEHHLSLTNLLPAKTIKVKWLGFCGWKKWNNKLPFPRNQGLSRAKAKTRNFPILDFF